jgi:hypothetical protein
LVPVHQWLIEQDRSLKLLAKIDWGEPSLVHCWKKRPGLEAEPNSCDTKLLASDALTL